MNPIATKAHPAAATALLAQADLVFVLSQLLRPPSDRDAAQASDALDALDALLAAAGLDALELRSALAEALTLMVETPPTARSGEYHRLFEGKLLCPPNQTAYVRRDKGAVLADICGFYHAFGFDFRADTGEKPDHIVTELEFCGVLLTMIAVAEHGERARIAEEALVGFADCHLGEWLAWFAARLQAVSQIPFYNSVATALQQAWVALAAAQGLRAAPSSPMAQPEQTPDDPYACGGAPAPQETRVQLNLRP